MSIDDVFAAAVWVVLVIALALVVTVYRAWAVVDRTLARLARTEDALRRAQATYPSPRGAPSGFPVSPRDVYGVDTPTRSMPPVVGGNPASHREGTGS